MADTRFKFVCKCSQRLLARQSMAGSAVFCPACCREIVIPQTGEPVVNSDYEATERYAIACTCGCRMLVKAEAAGHSIHCPECAAEMRVPGLGRLAAGKTPALVRRTPAAPKPAAPRGREYINTEDLILLVDDEEGPGTDIT